MIKYVKDNCFKGRNFKDAEEAKAFRKQWLNEIANKRVHGTTKKVPAEVFESIEKEKLLPLPPQEYIICNIKICTVIPNCHISYKGNYCSVPDEHIGEKVDVIAIDNLLRIFYKGKEIALHPLVKDLKGQHITNKEHHPKHKTITPEEIKSRYREQMAEIGSHALEFFEKFLVNSGNKYSYRSRGYVIKVKTVSPLLVLPSVCNHIGHSQLLFRGSIISALAFGPLFCRSTLKPYSYLKASKN